jgi:hypothetical protein
VEECSNRVVVLLHRRSPFWDNEDASVFHVGSNSWC